jgi:DNA-nicking Smr family endonuclease
MKTRKRVPSSAPPLSEEEKNLFRQAVEGVKPLPHSGRVHAAAIPAPPLPLQSLRDEQAALSESLSDWVPPHDFQDEDSFLRPGLSRQILKHLRRGHWAVQDELDLHGHTSDEALSSLVAFLKRSRKRGLRCVRVIHGKGLRSKNREPVLKYKVRAWLSQREEILAYCEARPVDGGSGAMTVLLKA